MFQPIRKNFMEHCETFDSYSSQFPKLNIFKNKTGIHFLYMKAYICISTNNLRDY